MLRRMTAEKISCVHGIAISAALQMADYWFCNFDSWVMTVTVSRLQIFMRYHTLDLAGNADDVSAI